MNARRIRILGALLLLTAPLTASAAITDVFNNFGPGNSFGDSGRLVQGEGVGTIGNVDQAVQFTVGNDMFQLESISLGIGVSGPPNTGTGPLDILLAADAGGLPGATLRTFSLNVNNPGKQIVTGVDNGTFSLLPNTTYWVIADGKGSFDGGWNFNTIGDVGPTAGRTDGNPWNLRPQDDRMALRVQGTVVPEPATMALCGLGLAVLAGRRGKK